MRYEISVVGRLGPLMTSALGDVQVAPVPPHTVVMVPGTPDRVTRLLRRMEALGIEFSVLRVVSAGEEPSAQPAQSDG